MLPDVTIGVIPAPVNTPNQFSERHRKMYESLSRIQRHLDRREMNSLSEKPGFASHWRMLAEYFRFTPGEVDHIMRDDEDSGERCYNFLNKWFQKEYPNSTVSRLIQGVYEAGNTTMLEVASSVIQP